MNEIGEELRRARELKGISLREVEEATKIRMKYLIALEAEDFDALPGRVYVIGFLRTYARFLGLNDQELASKYKNLSETGDLEEDLVETNPLVRKGKKGSFLLIIIALILLLGAIAAFYTFGSPFSTKDPSRSNPSQVQNPGSTGDQENTPAPDDNNDNSNNDNNSPDTEEEITGVSVTVIVREASCWVNVNIDGKESFQGTLNSGENRTFVGKENIRIKYGNAGVVEVIYNGKDIYPLGSYGKVLTQEYTQNQSST